MKAATLQFIQEKLAAGISVMLLYVVFSEGSSPGRQGFHMAVAEDEQLLGSIGGGIMEHKLVEFSKQQLSKKEESISLKYQYHDKSHTAHQSGMICSGHQIIAFVPFYQKAIKLIEASIKSLNQKQKCYLNLSSKGLLITKDKDSKEIGFYQQSEKDWSYLAVLNQPKVLHIFGGGHVSLALSELMRFLGFYIKVYEDRSSINTLMQNNFCHEKHIVSYSAVRSLLADCEKDYVVIMTFGYRADKVVLKQLLDLQFFYIGMMGSAAKIKTLLADLVSEGYPAEAYQHVFTPIGLEINSKTPQEIAVSIAAEIIRETNGVRQ